MRAMMTVLRILGIVAVFAVTALIGPFAQAQDNNVHHFKLTVSGGSYPTISGTTDLPDGTKLFVYVLKPHLPDGQQRMARGLPACEDDCLPATYGVPPYVDPVVKNGAFLAGPFSFGGKPVRPNVYPIRISVVTNTSLDTVYISEIWMPGR
jgi:hypothetical protein